MLLRATGLKQLPEGGYYDLYLTRGGKPLVLCGTFNANGGAVAIRMTAAYELKHFDQDGWVVTRQLPGHRKELAAGFTGRAVLQRQPDALPLLER